MGTLNPTDSLTHYKKGIIRPIKNLSTCSNIQIFFCQRPLRIPVWFGMISGKMGQDKKVSYCKQIVSAFVVNPVIIFLAASLITMQNLFVVSHTVCTQVEGPKFWWCWEPPVLMGWRCGCFLEICFSLTYVTMPNSVILSQTVIMEICQK